MKCFEFIKLMCSDITSWISFRISGKFFRIYYDASPYYSPRFFTQLGGKTSHNTSISMCVSIYWVHMVGYEIFNESKWSVRGIFIISIFLCILNCIIWTE